MDITARHFWICLSLINLLFPWITVGLKFAHNPVTADSDVIIVNRPVKLTCNFVKYRTETIREIKWFIGYTGFRSEIFQYVIATGDKKGSVYPFIKTDEATASESELRVTLTDFRDPNMTFACEVESLRDNGYGKLRHNKKIGESVIQVIDTLNHDLIIKPDPELGMNAAPGKPLKVTCLSRGSSPPPVLSIMINGKNVSELYSGGVEQLDTGSKQDYAIMGSLRYPTDDFFKNNMIKVECLAHYEDFLFDKKELALQKLDSRNDGYGTGSSGYGTGSSPPGAARRAWNNDNYYNDPYANSNKYDDDDDDNYGYGSHSSGSNPRQGKVSSGHQTDMIHDRLMQLVDPARHVHPGIPYDFFAGYVIMHTDNINPDPVTNNHGYGNSNSNGYVTLLGELPYDIEQSLSRNYGKVNKISEQKMRVKLEAAEVLNMLGNLGYRAIGASAGHGNSYVWTLERKNFNAQSG